MIERTALYYLGRIVTWLESLNAAGLLKDIPDAKAGIEKVVEQSRSVDERLMPFVFGQAMSWLESLAASGGLNQEAKIKTDKLLSELKDAGKLWV